MLALWALFDFEFLLTPLTKLGKLEKFAHHVCTHTTSRRIELEGSGWSGFVSRALRALANTAFSRVDISSRKYVKIRVDPCSPKNDLVSSRSDSFGAIFLSSPSADLSRCEQQTF